MKISLDHPIWSRLYGPYGVQDADVILAALSKNWDQPKADDLYWEKLHHQDTLYPVTYAAMPWLWEIAPKDVDNLCFFSHVLSCALMDLDPMAQFQGLPIETSGHAHSWLPESARLQPEDMPTLKALETWFDTHRPEIAAACIAAVPSVDDPDDLYHLLSGPAAQEGHPEVAYILELSSDAYDGAEAAEFLDELNADGLNYLDGILKLINPVAPDLVNAVRKLSSDQIPERCPHTLSLFD